MSGDELGDLKRPFVPVCELDVKREVGRPGAVVDTVNGDRDIVRSKHGCHVGGITRCCIGGVTSCHIGGLTRSGDRSGGGHERHR